jgi:Mannosyl-glycoprotein endo-beta-N-acetylglucosaminidase
MCKCKAIKHYNSEHNVQWCSSCLEFSRPKSYQKLLKRLSGIFLLILLTFSFIEAKCPRVIKTLVIYTPYIEKVELNDTSITEFLVRHECVLPNVAIGQFHIESNYYKSNLVKENNNIAGIKTSTSKYVIGYKNGHCCYRNIKECILDYIDIQNRYLKAIDGHYAMDKGYVGLLKKL